MDKMVTTGARWLLLAVAALVAAFLVGMRQKSPPVLDAVRRFNKAVSNPKQMATAGTPGAYASIVEHVGRRSGRTYRTPIGTKSIDSGFLITLPYGTRSDWVQNVLAAGSAIITAEGVTVAVERPEIVSTESMGDHFSTSDRRLNKLFSIEHCMIVHRAD